MSKEKEKKIEDENIIGVKVPRVPRRKPTPQERTRAAVYATGNKWAIENFNATHN